MFRHIVSNDMGDRVAIALSFLVLSTVLAAQTSGGRSVVAGHMHPAAIAANDRGRVDSSLQLNSVLLMLKPTAAQQADLDLLLAQQQDPSSANYHQWLTPEQYGARFGAPQADIDKVTAWLAGAGLNVVSVARGRNVITFSGNVRQVESALATEFHRYSVNGEMHFANATEPSVPAALAGRVMAFRGLNDFKAKPRAKVNRNYTSGSSGVHSLGPDDINAIYDVRALFDSGISGAGQKLVVLGQTDIALSDIQSFRSFFNLPANDPQIVLVPGSKDPGLQSGDQDEASLDIEFAGAAARDATIIFVNSTDVLGISAQYAIDQNLAPVITVSYGDCESNWGRSGLTFLQSLAQQANLQGITWIAASGDNGAADCFVNTQPPPGNGDAGLAVDSPASLPGVTGVGGTEMNEGSSSYFAVANNANHASVSTWIPEMAWNDSVFEGEPDASGGGASTHFAKPAWQTGPGVPADGFRDVPDISLDASNNHDPRLFYTGGPDNSGIAAVGGTSVASPTFAGIVTLLNQYLVANGFQKTAGLGNINPTLYALAKSAPAAFHDITLGDNKVNGCTGVDNCTLGSVGFNAGAGYDQITGLGSVDAFNLITSWPQTTGASVKTPVTMTLTSSAASVQNSGSVTLTATLAASNSEWFTATPPTGKVTFYSGGLSIGSATISGSTATLTVAASKLTVGFDSASAEYSGDATYATAAASVSLSVVSPTAMSIQGITNAASYNQAFSPGEIIAIFGNLLSGGTISASTVPLPTNLGGVTVSINGVAAPLYFVSPGQINAQLPYEVTSGIAAPVTVTYNNQSVTSLIPMSSYSPGIFLDSTGAPAGVQTAKRGQTVALYITGQGAVSPQPADGALPGATTPVPQNPISISVGGIGAATPYTYIGMPAWAIGLTQINFTIPTTAPLGAQPVLVQIGGATSAAGTISITN